MKNNASIFKFLIGLSFSILFCSTNLIALTNNWNEIKKIMPDDIQSGDKFGNSVGIAGGITVVASEYEDTGDTNSGAVYVFEQNTDNPNAWGQIEKLKAFDVTENSYFGHSVAIDGNTIVVGAYLEDTDRIYTGAAYVFERDTKSNVWIEIKKLRASDADASDSFGASVAISGNIIIIGAIGKDNVGAAYVFERNYGGSNNWGEIKKLMPSNTTNINYFGRAVDVDGDFAVIGAGAGYQAGAAYVFECNYGGTNNWGEVKKLLSSDIEDYDNFGDAVAIADDVIIVGAWGEDSADLGAGAAYIFEKNIDGTNNWGELKKLIASDAWEGSQFGVAVAIDGEIAVVGAWSDSRIAHWAGGSYIFERNYGGSNTWNESKKIIPYDLQKEDSFGRSVAIANDLIIVGALNEDSGGISAGAAYVFGIFSPAPSETFGNAPPLLNNSGIASGNNIDAVTEPGEPAHADNGGPYHSVWWDWSESTNGLLLKMSNLSYLQIDTSGSDFDTVLAVYTGLDVSNLTQIAANDDAGAGIITSAVTFQFNSSTTYHIAVDGKTVADTGNVVLNYAVIPEPCYLLFIIYQLLLFNRKFLFNFSLKK